MKTFSRTIELTEAQIEGLNTGSPVPLTLLTAPASGTAFVITGAQLWKTAGGAATVGTGEINISYGTETTLFVAQFANVDASGGALGSSSQNKIQYASISNAASIGASGVAVILSANAAIACATGTKAKIKLDCQLIDL